MSNFTYRLTPNFGASKTGQAANVVAKVYDSTNTLQATVNSSWTEQADAAGNAVTGAYRSTVTLNTTWLPAEIRYGITGQAGVWAGETVGAEAAVGITQLDLTQVLPAAPVANSLGEAMFLADILGGRTGTAQAGTSTTITLDAGASSDSTSYIGDDVYLYAGTGGGIRGAGQRRTAIAYNGTSKVLTVNRAWLTPPDNTSKFYMLPQPQVVASVSGTVSANVVQWSGTPSQLAADNTPLVSISANDAVHTAAASLNGMISAGAYTSGALVHVPTSGGTAIITNEQAIIQG